MSDERAREILDFWFLPKEHPAHGTSRRAWFAKDDAFDAEIRQRFSALIEEALAGGLDDWEATPQGALARILVLDQLPRNAFRGTPRAFAGDALAHAAAARLVDRGDDRALSGNERMFVYLPFEHAEDRDAQARSVALCRALAEEHAGFDYVLDYAKRHHDIVVRFGRFPHRNATLGRSSTDEELEFLRGPGSSF